MKRMKSKQGGATTTANIIKKKNKVNPMTNAFLAAVVESKKDIDIKVKTGD